MKAEQGTQFPAGCVFKFYMYLQVQLNVDSVLFIIPCLTALSKLCVCGGKKSAGRERIGVQLEN